MYRTHSAFLVLVFSVITLGIYWLVYISKEAKITNTICGSKIGGVLAYIFLGIITCGIYIIVHECLIIETRSKWLESHGSHSNVSIVSYLVWLILGVIIIIGPFIAFIKYVHQQNILIRSYGQGDKNASKHIEHESTSYVSL
jgi:hypothetical protein